MTWLLYDRARSAGNRCFFRIKHNLSLVRDWYYAFAPDADLLEVTKDQTVVGYELKGQRKHRTGEFDWPAFYDGLGQALAYLIMPFVIKQGSESAFEGGSMDYVYLVNARSEAKERTDALDVIKLTPLGYITMTPSGQITELVKPRLNPLRSENARQHLLSNLDTLGEFSEQGKTFRKLKEKVAL